MHLQVQQGYPKGSSLIYGVVYIVAGCKDHSLVEIYAGDKTYAIISIGIKIEHIDCY